MTDICLRSFEELEKTNPAAAGLLKICAFLAPEAILEDMLIKGSSCLGEPLASILKIGELRSQIVGEVTRLSLLFQHPTNLTIRIEREVQSALRERMERRGESQAWLNRAINCINCEDRDINLIPITLSHNPSAWENMLPHAIELARYAQEKSYENVLIAEMLEELGEYLMFRENYPQAEQLMLQALAINEKVFGTEHNCVLSALNSLSRLYTMQGKIAEGEPFHRRAQSIRHRNGKDGTFNRAQHSLNG